MPMSGSNYVAPTWVNNAPPALDAAELQAMCNAIVQNQGDAAALQAALQTLTTTVSGKAQIDTGSYFGTGTYGKSSPNRITFPFKPIVVFISSGTDGGYAWIYGNDEGSTSNAYYCWLTWSSRSLSWYSTSSASSQLNSKSITYRYIAIG